MVEMDRNHNPNINSNIFSGVLNHVYFSFDQETNKTLKNDPIPEETMTSTYVENRNKTLNNLSTIVEN